jgi:hypothetical protein
MKSASQELRADMLLLQTENQNARMAVYQEQVRQVGFAQQLNQRWATILRDRPLSDSELGELAQDLSRTPIAVMATIADHLDRTTVPFDVLVPRSLEYYERLVGRVEGQTDFRQYASEVLPGHVQSLLQWDDARGLHLALLLGSNSLVADLLNETAISAAAFSNVARWAVEADPLTQGITLELALRRTRQVSKFAPAVGELAKLFCNAASIPNSPAFDLLSTAFTLVDGELGKTRITAGKPPFWRRLAALAQAALISRCVLGKKRDFKGIVDGMRSIRMREYEVQCWIDLRLDPRWQANFATAEQLRHEVGGRVLMTAMVNAVAADKLSVSSLVTSEEPGSLKSVLSRMRVTLPGPLDGNLGVREPLQQEVADRMREALADESPSWRSFVIVANAALHTQLPGDIPTVAAAALRRANYHLPAEGRPDQVQSCLTSLAMLAADYRSRELADELFAVLRSYRRLFPSELDVEAAFGIGLLACASRSDFGEWCKCVGYMVADLAFAELQSEGAGELYSSVTMMCDMVPELWAFCGRGIAALEAVGWN